ncbi:MAG: hypothetical protein ABFS46_04365 [Myxococcota bacterium]
MWERRARVRESDPVAAGAALDLHRRTFLCAALGVALWPGRLLAEESETEKEGLPDAALAALPESEFVYVSPLLADGAESTCHGEVWYAWLDGAVVLITGSGAWKARSVSAGRDRARIWVGNHGPWKRTLGNDEGFRRAPSFVARARSSKDPELLERMLVDYERKYPDEIGRWRERFREGLTSGERVILRYEPA